MDVLTAACTDIGIKKPSNQDSYLMKVAETAHGKVVLAVICDGMGGLSRGEIASASVINAFSNWFDYELPGQLENVDIDTIQFRWERIMKEQNHRIAEFGKRKGVQLGTTATVMLLIDTKVLLIGHVGDTRVYRINSGLEVLTEDHTVVFRDLKRGMITPEQAKTDSRRNVLLQCIGASKMIEPDFLIGVPNKGEVYMLCSDGFRHKITDEEIHQAFSPQLLLNEAEMEKRAKELVELNKQRKETDNITVLLIKTQ